MSLIGGLIDKLLTSGRITVITPGKAPRTFGPGGGRELTVRTTDRLVPLEIFKNPRLGLGEAYMDGRLLIENGTILDLLEMITGSNSWEKGGAKPKALKKNRLKRLKSLVSRNTPTRSRRNVAHHYDLGNALYECFLDSDMQYSCAYFTDPQNSLEQAQLDKKAHIAAKLQLKAGQKVLDIGCGWGGTALYLHQSAGVDVLGITLSEQQLAVARHRAEEAGVAQHVRFELIDYRLVTGQFDRIVSVGMFEHVGAKYYDEFFAACHRLLKPDGVMLLHTIGRLGSTSGAPDPFTDKWIFPGYYLPSLSQMSAASEKARLIASDVETLRLHYAYTLRHWLSRVHDNREKIEAMYDARFFRMWEFYLCGGIVMFENGAGCNYQVQYIRDRRALPITRDYMARAEKRLRPKAESKRKGPANNGQAPFPRQVPA
ncbi:MAG TPA: cyclopropane-fatty-acyl-phospholipid synthase family protein [Sphingomicrobium sp.]|nr:cyclopropane-fatty-acyl-phospholipid synthase family protein [Sphingomicrobium sp.]